MPPAQLQTDVAILGGGVAGLWMLNRLRALGYSALLFESRRLGSGQSAAAQGIVHGGVKFAFGPGAGAAARAVADMPEAWRACLAGRGDVDLRDCEMLSEDFFLWSGAGPASRFRGTVAGRLLRARAERVPATAHAGILGTAPPGGALWRLREPVLDASSLLRALAAPHAGAIFALPAQGAGLRRSGDRAVLELPGLRLEAELVVLAAGGGNEALLGALGATGPAMQRRPLQQVVVWHEYETPLFLHCLGAGSAPRLTLTSHRDHRGSPLWYLGGALAERGAHLGAAELIAHARRELREALPWLDPGRTRWATVAVDRAEVARPRTARPADAFLGPARGIANAVVAWPTKLALCPRLGRLLELCLLERGLQPRHRPDLAALSGLERPGFAPPPWEARAP